jgi:hypothetical protein
MDVAAGVSTIVLQRLSVPVAYADTIGLVGGPVVVFLVFSYRYSGR